MAIRIQVINSKRYVSSYALYRALGLPVETVPYHQWIKTKVLRLNTLENNVDYIKNGRFEYEEVKRGPKPDDYHITIELALSICIFANTAVSKAIKKVLESL
jgi:phage anti-repressor protein